jgi:16S rRNA (guanine527-N7)-methyltransferase
MENFANLSREFLELTGTALTEDQLNAAHRYADLLVEWNQKISLTSITDSEGIRIKHFLDSFSCRQVMDGTAVNRVIDVGTGAGFPGLPLKLLYPQMHLSLVDSVAKKTSFLTDAVKKLQLSDVTVITERAEVLGQMSLHREEYDWALARAVAGMQVLVEYLLPLVKVGGYLLAQKGETAEMELSEAETAIQTLGGETHSITEVNLPGVGDQRFLVVIKKVIPTPGKFPRRVGIPSKRPL